MNKKIISLALVLVLVLSFCACSAKKEKVKVYNSSADFAELGLSLEAPEGASDLKYSLVESKNNGEDLNIAQIQYTYEAIACSLRTANLPSYNVSGYDESKASTEEEYDLNVGEYSSKIRVMQVNDMYVALWFLGEHSFSLSAKTTDPITFTSCAIDAANANVPETPETPETSAVVTTAPVSE